LFLLPKCTNKGLNTFGGNVTDGFSSAVLMQTYFLAPLLNMPFLWILYGHRSGVKCILHWKT